MRKIFVDLLKCSGISFFITFLMLIMSIIPICLISFFYGTNFHAPYNLFTVIGNTNDLGNAIEFNFNKNFGIQILLFYFCFTFVILGITYTKRYKKMIYLIISLFAILLQVLLMNSIVLNKEPFKETSINEIKELIKSNEDTVIYVGRDNCPECIIFKPKLSSFLSKEGLRINYLNTTGNEDEVSNFKKFYNELGVVSVPAVIFMEGGKIVKVLHGNKAYNEIENRMKQFTQLKTEQISK